MTYTEIIQALDKKYGYNSKAAEPVRKLNEVWEIVITCEEYARFNRREKIFAPTAESAEKKAYAAIRSWVNAANRHNELLEKRCRYENQKDGEIIYTDEDIEEMKAHIGNIYINVTNRDGNKRTVTVK